MGLFKKKEEDMFFPDTSDTLIVFDDENKTSDIVTISEIRDEAVIATGRYKIPIQDCEITTGRDGRIFFYRAPSQSVLETERLAKLEFNAVLTQVTAYNPPIPPATMDWTKGMLFAGLIIAIIVGAF